MQQARTVLPVAAQDMLDQETSKWASEWRSGHEYPDIRWPGDIGRLLEPIAPQQLKDAAPKFPESIGLGWAATHPEALLHLGDQMLRELLDLLHACETSGKWPTIAMLVIVVLLGKPDGGFRPMGLLSLFSRI